MGVWGVGGSILTSTTSEGITGGSARGGVVDKERVCCTWQCKILH